MPRYMVTLTNEEIQELKALIQKGGKGYRIKHAQILLKLEKTRHGHMIGLKTHTGHLTVLLQVLRNGSSWMDWKQPWGGRFRKTDTAR